MGMGQSGGFISAGESYTENRVSCKIYKLSMH